MNIDEKLNRGANGTLGDIKLTGITIKEIDDKIYKLDCIIEKEDYLFFQQIEKKEMVLNIPRFLENKKIEIIERSSIGITKDIPQNEKWTAWFKFREI